jgi:FKBP-type peptidyl-prolyl cis-trans isomerase
MRGKLLLSTLAWTILCLMPTGCNKTPTKLEIEDLKEGTGPAAKVGDLVEVDYTGKLTNGKVFDSSLRPGGQPLVFQLGRGKVIKGWDQGVVGMKVGGKRKLTIPPDLAYGAEGYPPDIPPNAVLSFEVELLSINKKQ